MFIESRRKQLIIVAIMAISAGLIVFLFSSFPMKEKQTKNNTPVLHTATQSKVNILKPKIQNSNTQNVAIIFASQRESAGKAPTVWDIQKTTVNSDPVILTTINDPDLSEYDSILTQGDQVFIVSNKSLKLLDLKLNKYSTLIKAKQSLTGAVFSPDRKYLFIMDHEYGKKPIVYMLTVSNLKYVTLYPEVTEKYDGMLSPAVWRADNKVLLHGGLAMLTSSWYLDMKTNKIFPAFSSAVGPKGRISAIVFSWTNDDCNLELRSGIEFFQFIDPLSNEKFSQFGEKNKLTTFVRFSPDESKAMYYTEVPYSQPIRLSESNPTAGCNETYDDLTRRQYFIVNPKTGDTQKVVDYKRQLLSWYPDEPIVTGHFWPDKNNQYIINLNDEPFISSNRPLKILTSYFSTK